MYSKMTCATFYVNSNVGNMLDICVAVFDSDVRSPFLTACDIFTPLCFNALGNVWK